MTHISSIGAGIYSDLSVCVIDPATFTTIPTDASGWAAHFGTEVTFNSATATAGSFKRIVDVREFPSMGTPPNIVNVPTYGFKTSKQVQGQADAPSFEVTLNFVPEFWQNTANYLGYFIGDGKLRPFRFALLNSKPTSYSSTATSGMGATASNTVYYWAGKLEALQISPQLTDATTATLTISIQSDFYGAYTVT
jgi:hypothetical protein